MDAAIKLLHEFPAIWAVLGAIGTFIACILFWLFVGRKMQPMYINALEGAERVLEMQKKHYEEELTYLKQTIDKLEKIRDDYKDKLHGEREAHNATHLEMEKLKLRPNVSEIYDSQQIFFTAMGEQMRAQTLTMQAIHDSLITHDQRVEQYMKKNGNSDSQP